MKNITFNEFWKDKHVMVVGACGTVGYELVKQLSSMDCARIVGIDNNETELFFIGQEYENHSDIEFFLCDLRDKNALSRAFRGIDIVLHAAALKHVVLCERSPRDAVATNIDGMMNVIDAAELNNIKQLIFTSSDKAVNPTNVMGTTKLMGERLITAANAHRRNAHDTIYASTRFGNILGSRGSVIPIFKQQIRKGGPLTITDNNMTRFIMTLKDAISLVLESAFIAQGGEVFVTKMPVIRITDLASIMIELLASQYGYEPKDIKIEVIGSKPGEKMYEELLSDEEVRRTIELKHFFTVLPAFKGVYQNIHYDFENVVQDSVDRPYNSAIESALTRDELKNYLITHNLLEEVTECVS